MDNSMTSLLHQADLKNIYLYMKIEGIGNYRAKDQFIYIIGFQQ